MSGGAGRNWRLVRADTDAVPSSARRFMARARQRRLRAALPWAVTGGVVLLIGIGAWVVYGTALFGVRDVRVVGVQLLTAQQVQQAVAVSTDEPLAQVDLDAVRDRVRGLPAVARVVVRRSWPSTLVVDVVERTPVAAVPAASGQFALIDATGVAYQFVAQQPAKLPLVRVSTPGALDPNTKSALTVLSALSDDLRTQLVAVSVAAPAQIKLELRASRKVIWGDDTQSDTKSQVATVLLRRAGNEIDVSAPSVVTIR